MNLFSFFWCRAPNPDTVLIIQTPSGVFSAKSLVQNKKKTGTRLILANREEIEESAAEDTIVIDPFSSARCRLYKRTVNSKKVSLLNLQKLCMHRFKILFCLED